MSKQLLIKLCITTFLLLSINIFAIAQNNNTEYWRKLGYEAKTNEDFNKAIVNYSKVLEIQSDDYDARLALARLYYLKTDYQTAISFYNKIYQNDSTDVEALNGFGACYMKLDEPEKASIFYEKAITFLPVEVQLYFDLAKAYSWDGKPKKAIEIYNKINTIDNTYSEAYSGIGKMLYWQGKPKSAISYYQKALALDPENDDIIKEYKDISNTLKYQISSTFQLANETEESYKINAFIQKYSITKRLCDHFDVSANFLLDYSDRNFTNTNNDTTRWFDNTWIKANWITANHNIGIYGGYSSSDDKFTSYGLNWKWTFNIKSLTFKNNVTAGYDYFYYWNQIGGKSITDNLNVTLRYFGFDAGYTFGIIDSALITDPYKNKYKVDFNNHYSYSFSLSYKVFVKPMVKIALNHSYLNYDYKSKLYYSPYGRQLTGASVTFYYDYKKFYLYGNFAYNKGNEYYFSIDTTVNKININVDNWSAEMESGYNMKRFSFSIGGNKFYNPYYSNYIVYFSVKARL